MPNIQRAAFSAPVPGLSDSSSSAGGVGTEHTLSPSGKVPPSVGPQRLSAVCAARILLRLACLSELSGVEVGGTLTYSPVPAPHSSRFLRKLCAAEP